MRCATLAACLAALVPAASLPAAADVLTRAFAAEVSYSIRDRRADTDGSWFATCGLSGDAADAETAEHPVTLSCIGSAWGFGVALSGESAICRFAQGSDLPFARVRTVAGTVGDTALEVELHGGRGAFAGYGGWAKVARAMHLAAAPSSGCGAMLLRLELVRAIDEEE